MPTKMSPTSGDLIEPGKTAPAFNLKDQDGEPHRLSGYKGHWVVLYFYPRDNTPGCTKQACGFRDTLDKVTQHGAVIFGVSPDDAKKHQKFTGKYELNFPLLVDPEQKVAKKYGVWQEKSLYGKKYIGMVRTTYLIDPNGKVAKRWDKVKVAGHVQEVVDVLQAQG